MARFVRIPPQRMDAAVLQSLLEDYASRDGTDYGLRERTLAEKVGQLQRQLDGGELAIVYDLDGEDWDLLDRQRQQEIEL